MKQKETYSTSLDEILRVKEVLDDIKTHKEATYDNRSEKWQESEKGEAAKEEIDSLDEIVDYLESAISNLEDLINNK